MVNEYNYRLIVKQPGKQEIEYFFKTLEYAKKQKEVYEKFFKSYGVTDTDLYIILEEL